MVPLNQPNGFAEVQIGNVGGGGSLRAPWIRMVSGHQIRKITTITVVICMMRSALPLDS